MFRIFVILICIVILFLIKRNSFKEYDLTGGAKHILSKKKNVHFIYHDMKKIINEFRTEKVTPWGNIVDIGDKYSRGVYPFLKPNKKMALLCFETAAKCPDKIVAGNARMKISELVEDSVDEEDQRGDEMNIYYGDQIVKIAVELIKEVEITNKKNKLELEELPFFTQVTGTKAPGTVINPSPISDLGTIGLRNLDMLKQNNKRQEELLRPRKLPPTPRAQARVLDAIGGGAQSAHDHGVTTSTKYNISSLLKEFRNKNQEFRPTATVLQEVTELCHKIRDDPYTVGLTVKQIKKAKEVAESLAKHAKDNAGEYIMYSDTGITQVNILDLVLWKMKNIPDKELRDNIGETLCKRLSDAKPGDYIVCGTGKISRIVSVFEGVLEDKRKCVSIKLVEKEIAHLAAKVREDFLNTLTNMGRKAYESVNSVPEYTQFMTKEFLDKVNKEYVQKLKMSPSIIKNLTDIYVEAF